MSRVALLAAALITDKRPNGDTFVRLADGSPEWMTDVVRAAHGDRFPNDDVYTMLSTVADALEEADGDEDDARTSLTAPYMTHTLMEWATGNVGAVDEAMEEQHFKSLSDAITWAWHEEAGAMLATLVTALGDADDDEPDDDDESE